MARAVGRGDRRPQHADQGLAPRHRRTRSRARRSRRSTTTSREHGAKAYFPFLDKRQGIVHVIGPEQGATLPGMTVVCGDSHTSTHGAFAALAFGIGTSEVEHVLATQCLLIKKAKSMLIRVDGRLRAGVTAKDLVLAIIGRIGTAGGSGHAIEFGGEAVRALSMEARMTMCNMAIEAGARAGHDRRRRAHARLRARDGRSRRPARCGTARSRSGARCAATRAPASIRRTCSTPPTVRPQVTWGTSPEMVVSIEDRVPDPDKRARCHAPRRHRARVALHGTAAEHADDRHPDRQGVHRVVHQFAHRGPARRPRRSRAAAVSPAASSSRWSCRVPGS